VLDGGGYEGERGEGKYLCSAGNGPSEGFVTGGVSFGGGRFGLTAHVE